MNQDIVKAELDSRIKTIANSLVLAYGGQSQVGHEEAGKALARQVNNNGLGCFGTLEELCEALACELSDDTFEFDAFDIELEADMEMKNIGLDPEALPYPFANLN